VTIEALTNTGQYTRAIERPRPLLSVMAWELRRFRASRAFWLQALGVFCVLLLLTWAQKMPEHVYIQNGHVSFSGFVAGTSASGLLHTLPLSLVVLAMLLPFVNADSVARDVSRRTHELLMTTALPTRAYVWGRYLTGLLVSLGLALLMLAAIQVMGLLLHLTVTDYPAPQIGNLMILWVGMVIPATILVSSLSFALGTLLPRLTALVKVVILVGWIVGAVILPAAYHDTIPPTWYVNWDPTGAITGLGLLPQYSLNFGAVTSAAHLQHLLLTVENTAPDVGGWFAPHLILAGLSLVLVLVAALAFSRSRETLT
jgi:ABC-type transport system involved in multi-copper enzyme maturation permease subunit